MTKKEAIKLFEEKKVRINSVVFSPRHSQNKFCLYSRLNENVRTVWDDEQGKWYFSIVDVVSILTDSVDGRKYWNKLKERFKKEGNQTVTNCH